MSCSLRLTLKFLQELMAGGSLIRPSISMIFISSARGAVIVSVEAHVIWCRSSPLECLLEEACQDCFSFGWISIGAKGEDGAVESGLDFVRDGINEVSRSCLSLMDTSSFIFEIPRMSVSVVTDATVSFTSRDGRAGEMESQLVHGRFEGTLITGDS